MKYTFDYCDADKDQDAVDIPTLDAFRAELDAVCKKYGVAFEHDGGWREDGGGHVKLVPYGDDANSSLFDHLYEADEGVPWIDEARARFNENRRASNEARNRAEAERHAAQNRAHVESLLTQGVLLDGKRYKLVPQE